MAVVMLVAVKAGAREGNLLVSTLIWTVATATIVGAHIVLTFQFLPSAIQDVPDVYVISVIAAFLVFAAMQYNRFHVSERAIKERE